MSGLQDPAADARRAWRLNSSQGFDGRRSREIGSELEFDERSIFEPIRCTWDEIVPHSNGSLTLLHSGRSAIRSALRAIASVHSERLRFLVPCYLCPAVLQPFDDLAIDYEFYPVTEDLCIDWEQVRQRLDTGRYAGLLFIRYFGSTACNAPPRDMCSKDKPFHVIEDLAQAMLSPCAGNRGDYVTYSLRKFLGLPDGGAVVARNGSAVPAAACCRDEFFGLRMMAFRLRDRFRFEGMGTRDLYLESFRQAERALDSSSVDAPMSWFSQMLTIREDPARVRRSRQTNFAYLHEHWPKQTHAVPLRIAWQPSDVPLGFPVWADDRDAFQQALISRKIFPPIHWHLPEAVRMDQRFRAAHRLSEHILTIPCDQRYGLEDMKRIVHDVADILN